VVGEVVGDTAEVQSGQAAAPTIADHEKVSVFCFSCLQQHLG